MFRDHFFKESWMILLQTTMTILYSQQLELFKHIPNLNEDMVVLSLAIKLYIEIEKAALPCITEKIKQQPAATHDPPAVMDSIPAGQGYGQKLLPLPWPAMAAFQWRQGKPKP
jgi:hypothetical protein